MNNLLTKSVSVTLALTPLSAPVFSAEVQPLFGQWGTEAQCARTLISPKGTKKFAPFDIRQDWLGHGDIWCRLDWSTTRSSSAGLYAVAHGRCGEDTVREYQISFELSESELTLRWNQDFENGPLRRCVE